MKRTLLYAAALVALASTAQAACFVEYKAKQDDPLNLHYGIIKLDGPCAEVEGQVGARLAPEGWELLTVLSATNKLPNAAKREDAGGYFLRF
ncbi:MAG: hypothetical protein ACPG5U_03065 [Planktomarina sp.]